MIHKHNMAVRFIPDFADLDRPHWARLYDGANRWIIIDYCTESGCEYQRARDITYEKPVEVT